VLRSSSASRCGWLVRNARVLRNRRLSEAAVTPGTVDRRVGRPAFLCMHLSGREPLIGSGSFRRLLRKTAHDEILNGMVKYEYLDAAFGALADPIRRAVLGQLTKGESTVSELASGYPISLPAFLRHIRVLENAGLVATRKIGRVRYCRYSPKRVVAAEEWLREHRLFWERQLDQLERHFANRKREN
jgi:DNA-binding transcriptional ArsR family regulator